MEILDLIFENTCYIAIKRSGRNYETEKEMEKDQEMKNFLTIPWIDDCLADDFDFFNREFQEACDRIVEAIGQ